MQEEIKECLEDVGLHYGALDKMKLLDNFVHEVRENPGILRKQWPQFAIN